MQRAVRRIAAMLAFALAGHVHAVTWTALWWNPAEPGWGVTITQQNNVIVLTFLVYGADGLPHWYEAAAYSNFSGGPSGYATWNGDVYESTGPYFGGPFDPARVTTRKVGTVSFSPATPGTATLKYSIDGVAVTKAIERQTFQRIKLLGVYRGSYRVAESGCAAYSEGDYGSLQLAFSKVTLNPDGVSGSLSTFMTFNETVSCTTPFQGTYRQLGTIFEFGTLTACSSKMWAARLMEFDAVSDELQGNMQGTITAQGADGCQVRLSVVVQRQ